AYPTTALLSLSPPAGYGIYSNYLQGWAGCGFRRIGFGQEWERRRLRKSRLLRLSMRVRQRCATSKAPSTKLQAPEKHQAPNSKVGAWNLELGIWSFYVVSRHHPLDHLSLHISQSEIAAIIPIGEFLMIESKQRENGRVQIVNVNFVFDRRRPKFVGRAIDCSTSNTTAGQQRGESFRVMIASGII